MTTSITGRTALVTGGGSGIGLAIAARLAADGAQVAICGRTESKLDDAVTAITGQGIGEGGSIRRIVADITVEDQITAAVAFAAEPTGGLDILVANAGGSLHMGPFADGRHRRGAGHGGPQPGRDDPVDQGTRSRP